MSAYRHSHLGLQGLAYAGVVVGYVPLLTLLLPLKLSEMVPADGQVGWLSLCAIGGAVSASLGGVLGGWASDRFGRRRTLLSLLVLSAVVLLCFGVAPAGRRHLTYSPAKETASSGQGRGFAGPDARPAG
jgi:MFS family permease